MKIIKKYDEKIKLGFRLTKKVLFFFFCKMKKQ